MAEDAFRKLFRSRQRFIRAADDAVDEATRIFSQDGCAHVLGRRQDRLTEPRNRKEQADG